jgi:transposase-like protein
MKRNCPNLSCHSQHIIKSGSYYRAGDSRTIQRYQCTQCAQKFSSSTGTLEYRQRKRRINSMVLKLLCSKMTQRRIARVLAVNPKTIARRQLYWSKKANLKNKKFMQKLTVFHLQFDDLITKEKTKLKPLSLSVAVDVETRYILSAKVSQIPAFGHLSQLSKNKYGPRSSTHNQALDEVFSQLKPIVNPKALIESDEHKNYSPVINRYFPKAEYKQYKSDRATIAGQGELKKTRFDPIFCINHTLAMMRDSIAPLVRRTWCTTQDPRRLQGYLEIFIYYYNQFYLKKLNTT